MIGVLLLTQAVVQMPAPGIAQAVPPTSWNCSLQAADGTKFAVAGTSPEFPAGSDPNASKFVTVQSTHAEAFRRPVGITPGDAGEWFREFQLASSAPGGAQYMLNLMLRREGASIAYATRYVSDGRQVPYEYYAVGLCNADFAPAPAGQEKAQ
jgi:hypothetical protein